jgi:hypothetical protein
MDIPYPRDAIEEAGSTLALLQAQHAKFLSRIGNLATKDVAHGTLDVKEKMLVASSLGEALQVRHRPVANSSGKLSSIEYAFFASIEDEQTPIWAMYLSTDGNLFLDADLVGPLLSAAVLAPADKILTGVGAALLKSKAFAPTFRPARAGILS